MAATYTCSQYLSLEQPLNYGAAMSTTYTLDAARFNQPDLHLFLESLETISRLERERHERSQRRREQKLQQARRAELENESLRSRSPTPSVDEAVDEPVMYFESKCIPYAVSEALPLPKDVPEYASCDDEAYGSASQSPRSSVTYCSCGTVSNTGIDSDSAESGVYGHVTPPLCRPRSEVITKPKQRTARSRLIDMVLKCEYTKAPSAEELHLKEQRDLNLRQQYGNMSSKSRKGIACGQNSAEERFLDKALRYLTL